MKRERERRKKKVTYTMWKLILSYWLIIVCRIVSRNAKFMGNATRERACECRMNVNDFIHDLFTYILKIVNVCTLYKMDFFNRPLLLVFSLPGRIVDLNLLSFI